LRILILLLAIVTRVQVAYKAELGLYILYDVRSQSWYILRTGTLSVFRLLWWVLYLYHGSGKGDTVLCVWRWKNF